VDAFVAGRRDVSWVPPEAGSVGLLRLHEADEGGLVRLLETEYDATVAPGSMFEAPGHVRVGFGMETPELEEGLQRLGEALDRL
jgi:DNA-binding transcriptional MocR family regulator